MNCVLPVPTSAIAFAVTVVAIVGAASIPPSFFVCLWTAEVAASLFLLSLRIYRHTHGLFRGIIFCFPPSHVPSRISPTTSLYFILYSSLDCGSGGIFVFVVVEHGQPGPAVTLLASFTASFAASPHFHGIICYFLPTHAHSCISTTTPLCFILCLSLNVEVAACLRLLLLRIADHDLLSRCEDEDGRPQPAMTLQR